MFQPIEKCNHYDGMESVEVPGLDIHYIVHVPYPRERGPTTECRPTLHFGLNFLLRSSVYSNMRPCVPALENAAQMAGL